MVIFITDEVVVFYIKQTNETKRFSLFDVESWKRYSGKRIDDIKRINSLPKSIYNILPSSIKEVYDKAVLHFRSIANKKDIRIRPMSFGKLYELTQYYFNALTN